MGCKKQRETTTLKLVKVFHVQKPCRVLVKMMILLIMKKGSQDPAGVGTITRPLRSLSSEILARRTNIFIGSWNDNSLLKTHNIGGTQNYND